MSMPGYKLHTNRKRGFTLLELLVVIAIIGVIASIVLASLNAARSNARDAQRLSVVREMRNAMELYYSDFGSYPQAYDLSDSALAEYDTDGILAATVLNTDLGRYYPGVPRDPLGQPTSEYGYTYWLTGNGGYALLLYMEDLAGFCETGVNKTASIFGAPDC